MRIAFSIILVAIVSIRVGFAVFGLTRIYYTASESQSPYNYDINFSNDAQAKDLGVTVQLNLLHFVKNWFVGEEKNVILEISAERITLFHSINGTIYI